MAEEDKEDDAKKGEAEGEDELGEGAPKKNKKKKMIIIAAAAILLLGGGGAGLVLSGVLGGKKAPTEAEGEATAGEHAAAPEKAAAHGGEKGGKEGGGKEGKEGKGGEVKSAFYPLGDILVNLNSDPKRPNFLKMKVSLELANENDAPALDALKPRIIDNFQVYLRELRIEDLRGSAGLYRLREELLLRVTEAVQPIRVKDVLFQEMLVQ